MNPRGNLFIPFLWASQRHLVGYNWRLSCNQQYLKVVKQPKFRIRVFSSSITVRLITSRAQTSPAFKLSLYKFSSTTTLGSSISREVLLLLELTWQKEPKGLGAQCQATCASHLSPYICFWRKEGRRAGGGRRSLATFPPQPHWDCAGTCELRMGLILKCANLH